MEGKKDGRKLKKMCPECGHKHRNGVCCHYYAEAPQEEADAGAGGEDEEDEGGDEEEEDLLGEKVPTGPVFKKEEGPEELPTPDFVKRIGWVRCNCKVGVPFMDRNYEQCPRIMQVGPIVVKQFDDILNERFAPPPKLLSKEEEELLEMAKARAYEKRQLEIVPLVMRFLRPGHLNAVPQVSLTWNTAANSYADYVDMRNFVPWQAYRAHYGEVTALKLLKPRVFSGGDKRILASDIMQGRVLALVTRDSGNITGITEKDNDIFVSSTNGSVRTYTINHDPKAMKLNRTLWDHSRAVTTMLMGLPSPGPCVFHGVENHVCWMFTSSEDRSFKVWNMDKFRLQRGVSPNTLRQQTLTCIAQSGRHLFAGTSQANINVFTLFDECDRDDVHACSTPGASKQYCLQVTLKLPPLTMSSGMAPAVTAIACTGYNYTFSHLWAADSTGQLTAPHSSVWFVPDYGLEFQPARTWKAHKGAVNAIASTWRHMLSVGDDGVLMVYELESLARIRRLDVSEWCISRQLLSRPDIPRRLKCISVQEDQEEGGMVAVGTNYGDIIVFSIGRMV